ncbi:DeoR family transcriptional regulator [Patescibacteria group bacterium]|nr:DeoR family transcriptional regulator [Patescibacteria group bacterium]
MENQELPRRALNLSLAIYRVTAIFPQGEVLVGQLRELGNEIAGDLAEENFADVENKINRLKIYFAVAKAQNWVKPMNWSILDFEYYKLRQEVIFELGDRGLTQRGNSADLRGEEKEPSIMSHNIEVRKKPVFPKAAPLVQAGSNSRQSKILDSLNKKGFLKMSDLIPLFKNNISERTLRNELQAMVASGLIKKRGVNKSTEYYKS